MALKKKKMYETQLEQCENNILRVNEQQMMLENQRTTVETVSALRDAAHASKYTMSEDERSPTWTRYVCRISCVQAGLYLTVQPVMPCTSNSIGWVLNNPEPQHTCSAEDFWSAPGGHHPGVRVSVPSCRCWMRSMSRQTKCSRSRMPWRSPSAPLLMSMRMSSWESWRWANALAFLHLLFAFDFHAVGRGLLCICNGMVHHQSIAPPHHEAKTLEHVSE